MIKSKVLLCLSIFTLFLLSACSSTKSDFALTEDATETLNKSTNKKKKAEKKQFVLFKYGNIGDYISVDETSVFVPNAFGVLKQKRATVTIDPKLQEAGFGSPYLAAYYYLFLDSDSRKYLMNAIDNYFSDFENKRLKRDYGSSFKVYGKTPVRLRWGTLSNSTPNNGETEMNLGYKFKEKSPYFIITIYPAFNEYSNVTDAVDRESMMLTYYFTKAQLLDLKSMLDNEVISKTLIDFNSDDVVIETESDDYDEYEETVVEDSADNQSEEVIEIDE
ncbi:MAG: hypothetical protein E7059_10710 [Treponema bryantii]|nr:hypothetical protein [Treponema bryantii]